MDDRNRASTRIADAFGFGSGSVMLATAATLLFLQGYRVFVPYLVFEVDQSEREQLAATGLVVFGLAFLGALLYHLAGGRIALWLAVATMAIARLGIQFSEDPGLRWMLGAATVIGWCWLLIVLLPRPDGSLPIGIGFAFALDLVIRALRGTLDLPWMPGIAAHIVSIGIVSVVLLSAWVITSLDRLDQPESVFSASLRYVGIGSGIALWLVIAGTPGFAEVRGALSLPAAFGLLSLGTLLALAEWFGAIPFWPPQVDGRLLAVGPGLLAAVIAIIWNGDLNRWLDLVLIPVFAYAVVTATMHCTMSAPVSGAHGRWRTGATLTLGLLVQTAFVFLYFARSGPLLLILLPAAVLTLAPLAGRLPSISVLPVTRALTRGVAALALLTIVTLGWLFIDDMETVSVTPAASDLTVMSFNIQEGFSNENIWSLETTAQTIEAHDPDIVFLQEITRGWLVMSSVDEVRWLADRLDMNYVYSGNSYDGLWGNAILTRLPIVSERSTVYSVTDNLQRGAVGIEVETDAGNLLVINTHLDNLRKGTPVRLAQIQELLDFWGGTTPAVIAGDFNADPGSPEWKAMVDAGFVDAAGDDSATTSEDERRIDYIWLTSDLDIDRYAVPDIWVSDHRPVVVSLSMPA